MRFLLMIPILLPLIAAAQVFDPLSGGITQALSGPSPYDQARLSLEQANYALAETQYQALLDIEPFSQEALDGLFAAWDAMGKYPKILAQAEKLYHADSSLFYANYHAYALLKLSRLPEARYWYHRALQARPGDFATNSYSFGGLGYTYQALGDYHKSSKYFIFAQTPSAIDKHYWGTTIAFKLPGDNKTAYGISQQVRLQSWHLKLGYENFLLDKEAFRQSYSATMTKEFSPVDINVSARSLQGHDERVYPAWQSGIGAEPKLYLGKIILKPALKVSYSHYPRFDAQQLSFIPALMWRDFSFSYALHGVFIDNEAADMDSTRLVQQFSIGKNLPWNLYLGLHYGAGNDTWLVDTDNVAIDTFNQNGAYYGASLSAPLFKLLNIYAYHQRWKVDSLSYLSLSVSY